MVTNFTRTETVIVESFIDGRRIVDVTVTYTWLNLKPLEGSTVDYNVWFGDTPLAASADPVLSLLDLYGVCKILLFRIHICIHFICGIYSIGKCNKRSIL